jgi:hypothetical protein
MFAKLCIPLPILRSFSLHTTDPQLETSLAFLEFAPQINTVNVDAEFSAEIHTHVNCTLLTQVTILSVSELNPLIHLIRTCPAVRILHVELYWANHHEINRLNLEQTAPSQLVVLSQLVDFTLSSSSSATHFSRILRTPRLERLDLQLQGEYFFSRCLAVL